MNTTAKLALIGTAAIAGLFITNRLYQPDASTDPQGSLLLPELVRKVETLESVHIRQHDQQTHLARGEQGWTVVEKSHYPADTDRLRKLLQQLSDARKVERKTARAEHFPRLNLADPDATEGGGTALRLDFGGETITLILGKRARAGGTLLRMADETQSWRVKPAIQAVADPMHWLDDTVVDLAPTLWQSLRVEPATGLGWTLARATVDERNFTLEPMPAGKTFKDEHISRSPFTALQMLHFTDVRPEQPDVDPAATLHFHGWYGDRLKVRVFENEDGNWFAFQFQPGPEPDSFTDKMKEKLPDAEGHDLSTLEQENLNAVLSGWWYRLPDYKASQLYRQRDDLLKDASPQDEKRAETDP